MNDNTPASSASRVACPGCADSMTTQSFARNLGGQVALDLCFDCQAIWFDHNESTQLAPGGIIRLFKFLHEHRNVPHRPLAELLACPRCATRLVYTHDFARSNAISYYRCEFCHGRLTTFLQFLREKQFVRSLTPPEIASLRAQVQQIRCSGCGAAIDIDRDSACPYCRAPVSMLDPDAVDKALKSLSTAEQTRTHIDPARLADALTQAEHARLAQRSVQTGLGADLVALGIGAVMALLES